MADIFEVLGEFGELEQAGGRIVTHSGIDVPSAPIIVFRHKNRCSQLAGLLHELITAFQGDVEWHFKPDGPGINWVLGPKRLWTYAEEHGFQSPKEARDRLRSEEPEFGIKANAELSRLADFIRSRKE